MLWIKAFHIITMVAWFAGLFYLPRLFVYHANLSYTQEGTYTLFCTMEKRLFAWIMTPSAILTLLLGGDLMHRYGFFRALPHWLAIKLSLVALLVMYHAYCGVCVKRFAHHGNTHSARFYRWFNEIPTVLLVGIVLLAVLKML